MAAKAELNVELQSWGSSLSKAANLHLTLANGNSCYFEVPVLIDDFLIQGVDHFQLRSNGHVSAPKKAGLGLDVNRSIIEATTSPCVEF
jgi:L-alanine-DL-glutamate epimerase-like enolase superfamily enzyme